MENINKLNRLDRIEYRLDERDIEDTYPSFLTWFNLGSRYWIFLSFIALAFFYSNYERGLELCLSLLRVSFFIFLISIVFGIGSSMIKSIKLKKLFNKYFEVKAKEVKDGRRRKKG